MDEYWDPKDWPTDPEERAKFKRETFLMRWHSSPTGRLASRQPDFQELPKTGAAAELVRRLFPKKRPEPGWQFVQFDVGPDEDGGRSVRMISEACSRPGPVALGMDFEGGPIADFSELEAKVLAVKSGAVGRSTVISKGRQFSTAAARVRLAALLASLEQEAPTAAQLARERTPVWQPHGPPQHLESPITKHVRIALANWHSK